ncbi:Dabb family protein [Subtercola sp. YIM 133946]|uniref:Dabb family protein n=1 Tax=Subtercola sp. YIM 133946 TaxID=3118909 RepID=UPI002F934429
MIRHIVTFTLAADSVEQRAEQAAFITRELLSLVGVIDDVESMQVVTDVNVTPGNAHVALIADYADHAALDRYQVHPDHVRVSGSIRPLLASRVAIDFEV